MVKNIKNSLRELFSSPIITIDRWQDARVLWILMSFVSLFLVVMAHSLFQNYLYMNPCEQCVYIRFAFFCMFFGGVIAAINPKAIALKIVGYALGFFGIIKGMGYSLKLDAIHAAAHGDDPFGVQGCSAEANFPFGLPLDRWFPDWFKITGDCGFDNPIVPDGTSLNAFQTYMVELYVDGWYLIPSMHFMNMAQACFLAFGTCFLILGAMFLAFVIKKIRELSK